MKIKNIYDLTQGILEKDVSATYWKFPGKSLSLLSS